MSKKIKMNYGEVEKVLDKLRTSASLLKATAKESAGRNDLKVVKTLNKLNRDVQALAQAYQNVLLHHMESTQKSVQAMKDTDEMVSSSIRHR